MAAADSAQRYALIEENLAEVLNDEIIKKILDEGRHPKIYWGELRTNSPVVFLDNDTNRTPQVPRRQAGHTAATSSPPSRSPSSWPPAAM
jgi:hypothetical protein